MRVMPQHQITSEIDNQVSQKSLVRFGFAHLLAPPVKSHNEQIHLRSQRTDILAEMFFVSKGGARFTCFGIKLFRKGQRVRKKTDAHVLLRNKNRGASGVGEFPPGAGIKDSLALER